ncbi:MAG: cytochrome C biogenesis protein [Candidatus Nanohaloarchaeota archaeon QJJ-5]|nr:cytochrome C biogenesis protein [Candidatus Nanohaloarchaeota archaeon QJJ-5]
MLPLYPGFLSYLTSRFDTDGDRFDYMMAGGLVAAGVVSFMLMIGLVFTFVLEQSLTAVTAVISPFIFGALAIASLPLIAGYEIGQLIPAIHAPSFSNPYLDAFGFGFFFGGVVLPCNPAFIATFLSRAFLFTSPASSLINFFLFGFGIGFPLLLFSVVSGQRHEQVIRFMTDHTTLINRGSGFIMLAVSLYYLIVVFSVIPP